MIYLWTYLFLNLHFLGFADSLIWDRWYTITVEQNKPFGYYQEKVQEKNKSLHFETHLFKLEEEFINEEHLGAVGDLTSLFPKYYQYVQKYRLSEIQISGSVENGNQLKITLKNQKETGKPPQQFTKMIPRGTILQTFFPLWLKNNLDFILKKKSMPFTSLLEDSLASEFKIEVGRATLMDPDEISQTLKTLKFQVEFLGNRFYWYMDKSGVTKRIMIPAVEKDMKLVTEKEAKSFLKK